MNNNFLSKKDFFKNNIVKNSINSRQYDDSNLNWDPTKKDLNSPIRRLMYRNLIKYIEKSRNKGVLDIGCGTGWLVNEVEKYKPKISRGIDPSMINCQVARSLFPNLDIQCIDFESFKKVEKYDDIYSVMTLSHFQELTSFFEKCWQLTKKGGNLIFIIPDYYYFKKKRENTITTIVQYDDCYAVSVEKNGKTLSQIVRKNKLYHNYAEKIGFKLLEEKSIEADDDLIEESTKKIETSTAMFYLMVYEK